MPSGAYLTTSFQLFHLREREREREREGERKLERGSVRHYRVGGGVIETEFGSWKVPRQCPLVLPVEARVVFGICSILIFKDVGAAVVGRNVV
jgi:hypothetical protein